MPISASALADAEGTAGGTEVAGGVMKWRVGLNWKVPMPDNDVTHGWITHQSARGPVGASAVEPPTTKRVPRLVPRGPHHRHAHPRGWKAG